jgi:hypothetical protein
MDEISQNEKRLLCRTKIWPESKAAALCHERPLAQLEPELESDDRFRPLCPVISTGRRNTSTPEHCGIFEQQESVVPLVRARAALTMRLVEYPN